MRLTTADLDIDLPVGWERAAMPGMDGFAYAPLRHPRFRTTAAIVGVGSGEPLESACLTAIDQLLAGFATAQVIGVDVWRPGLQGEGRQITSTAALPDGQQICLTQWVWATGERHLCLATSVGMPDTLLDAPALHNLAESARFPHDPVPSTDGALEDLRWVADRQRYRPTGRHVPEGALPTRGAQPTTRDLAELGLLGDDGSPTALAAALGERRLPGQVQLRLRARRGSSFTEVTFSPLDRGHVIEAGPPVWRLEAADPGPWLPGSIELAVASFDAGPAVAARWLGLAPVWSRDLGAIRIDRPTLEAKVNGDDVRTPRGLNPLARDAWRDPWTRVELEVLPQGGAPTLRMEWLRTPEHGWLAVEDHDGRLRLTALRSVTLFHRIQQAFGVPVPQADARATALLR